MYPSYDKVLLAKKGCYPTRIECNERGAKVSLQSLLNHTARRLLESMSEREIAGAPSALTLTCKWACDGSTGHQEYQQEFFDQRLSDSSVFLSTLVPLELKGVQGTLVWTNERPSSTKLCRPLGLKFTNDTSEVIIERLKQTRGEISQLTPSVFVVGIKGFTVRHELLLTMVDGKIANILMGISAMVTCCVCRANPSQMNNLDAILKREESIEALMLSISPLHARIKSMECFLHIAYRSEFKQWRVDTEARKNSHKERRGVIISRLKAEMGLRVDSVKGGMGNTNDGNTARRFFRNIDQTSAITGVDRDLLHRFSFILEVINCTSPIDVPKFRTFCTETARRYVEVYPWYDMPNAVHRLLIHGPQVAQLLPFPPGALSEEAQEASNKLYKSFRLNSARKTNRTATNEYVFHMLLAHSDPVMFASRTAPAEAKSLHTADVLSLLL